MTIKRFLASIATLGYPKIAFATLLLTGVGGIVVGGMLTTPTITPQGSAYFNQNQALSSFTNNALRANNNTVGAFEPPTSATQSVTFYGEMQVNASLGNTFGFENPIANLTVMNNGVPGNGPGQPQFLYQKASSGTGTNWLQSAGAGNTSSVSVGGATVSAGLFLVGKSYTIASVGSTNFVSIGASANTVGVVFIATGVGSGTGTATTTGTNYNTGLYPFTTTGGGCARQPTGVWNGGTTRVFIVDPGLGCQTAPTIDPVNIAGDGALQATGAGSVATTCVSNSPVSGEMTVTAHVAVVHGLTPGMTYPMQNFTAETGYNATYTALPGTTGTTLIGDTTTGGGTCPSSPATVEGSAFNGTGATIAWPAFQLTNPTQYGPTGVTTKSGQHVCFAMGEYGSDSNFPGGQFFSAVDESGTPLPGAPSLVPVLNQGTANFTGSTVTGAQSPATPALTVSAMNPYTLSAVTWTSTSQVNFTVTTNPGFVQGSEFTVSGVTPSAYNLTYVVTSAVGGSGSAWTFTGSPLSGPVGTPQGLSSTANATGFGSLVSVIMPGMQVLGSTPAGSVISPYGTFGSTGTGGTGTYGLSADQTVPISSGTIFAFGGFYYSAVSSGNPAGGVATARSQATIGDFFGAIGSGNANQTAATAFGGTLANLATLWGVFPQTTGGAPDTTALASLCKKTTTIPAFATANSLTVHSFLPLNDSGIWGDASVAQFHGHTATNQLTIDSTETGSLPTVSGSSPVVKISGPGLPPAGVQITSGSAGVYTLASSVGTISSEAMKAGGLSPASPVTAGTFLGFLAGSTLTVTSYPTGSQTADFTGTLGGASSPFTTLTVSSVTGTLQAGELVTDGGAILTGPPLLITGGGGTSWTVLSNYNPTITGDTTMVASINGLVPGSYIFNSAITTPIKITGYGTGNGFAPPTAAQAATGVTYTISNPGGLSIGSLGTPATFTLTGIQDGAPVAPGPALTIRDLGPGIEIPVNFSTGTGAITVSGTYDTATLGGTPTILQAQVSLSADPTQGAVPGCSACAWTNLTSYTSTLSSGTKFNWTGSAINIPAGSSPLYVSVRAANGTAYATTPNYFKIGVVVDLYGEGTSALVAGQAGFNIPTFGGGLWGGATWKSGLTGNEAYLTGPPVLSNWVPSYAQSLAGDRFGFNGGTSPALAEGIGNFDQTMTNATGWPTTYLNLVRDGIGMVPFLVGNSQQNQTVGVGNATLTTWCSSTTFCANSSPSAVSVAGSLYYNVAALSGATLAGASISSNTLTVPAATGIVRGALMPGLILNVGTNLTLQNCLTGCTIANFNAGAAETWALSNTSGNALVPTRADPAGGAAWPASSFQRGGLPIGLGGFGSFLIKAGTFSISVNGTVVCTDSNAFAYNQTGGNCTGAGITSSFVNYQTGDYQVTFTTAPAANAVITASWTNIVSPEGAGTTARPQGFDFVGDGGFQSGPTSAIYNRATGGINAHIFQSGQSDWNTYLFQPGYQFGAVGYTQALTWLYTVRYPSIFPNMSAATPFVSSVEYRSEGNFWTNFTSQGDTLLDQYGIDAVTQSTFPGSISGGVLTLSGAAVGPMWEGEIIGGAGMTSPTGIYITGLASGTWGASGSTYNLSGASGVSASGAMFNDVYWKGSGPAIYAGPMSDVSVLAGGLAQTTLAQPHTGPGMAGGRRVGARLSSLIWGGLSSTPVAGTPPANSSAPTIDRVKADAINCDAAAAAAPCLSVSGFPSTASASWTTGGIFTVTGGLAAHALPFVLGQSVTCSPSCGTGLVITSVDHPPTQDTTSGQGQVGQTFTFTVSGTVTSNNSGTATGACSGTSGTSSNCILLAYKINTTAGTFGTSAALATCGENNLNGASANYVQPTGKCSDNGIGTLVRDINIGTTQNSLSSGGVYDDGVDYRNDGAFSQSKAFTCNIAAAKVVRCVKGTGVWSSGATFIGQGENNPFSGRIASVVGYVGGQTFPFTPGSGYSPANSTITETATCSPLASGASEPKFDVTTTGGAISNVYPSSSNAGSVSPTGFGLGGTCTVPLSGFTLGSGGAVTPIILAPTEGVGGVATFNTDSNTMGLRMYDNSGFPGNPLNQFFTNGLGGYFEPGNNVQPYGEFQRFGVSG